MLKEAFLGKFLTYRLLAEKRRKKKEYSVNFHFWLKIVIFNTFAKTMQVSVCDKIKDFLGNFFLIFFFNVYAEYG